MFGLQEVYLIHSQLTIDFSKIQGYQFLNFYVLVFTQKRQTSKNINWCWSWYQVGSITYHLITMSSFIVNNIRSPGVHRKLGYQRVAPLQSRRVTTTGSITSRKTVLRQRLYCVSQQTEGESSSSNLKEPEDEEVGKKEIEIEAEEAETTSNGTTAEETQIEEQEEVKEEVEKIPIGPRYLQLITSLSLRIKEDEEEEGAQDLQNLEKEIQAIIQKSEEQEKKREKADLVATAAKEQFLRLQADFDNFRKRSAAEKSDAQSRERASLVEQLLPLVDNFELAATQIKIVTPEEQKISDSYQGLYRQMVDIFRGIGISAVDTVGSQFDPEVHEAIMREPNEEVADGTVLEEFRKGFTIDGKLIRPAMVKVSFREQSEASSSSEGSDWESEPENSVDGDEENSDAEQQPENANKQT
eukprot:TRINITY_DN10132_c0_g2_i1.p1 TRINITY_DN10132_c0_g2~~TRINITY_DN10132_c0_g2_i1.p1  ORF type:complete len:469 (-),score=74.10 TRINITY_DN10132_c0_g2_i1:393-1631(-)